MAGAGASRFIESRIHSRPVVLFSKSYCPESKKIKQLLKDVYTLNGKQYAAIDVERRQDVSQIEDYFMIVCLSERRELWIGGKYVGNEFKIMCLHESGELGKLMQSIGIDIPEQNPTATSAATPPK